MEIKHIIKEFKDEVHNLYGTRLKKILLYGSWARGNATDSSDIDLAIIFEGKIIPGVEIDRLIDIITEINLKYNSLISVYPVSEDDYSNVKSPLLMNLHKKGILL